MIRSSKLSTKFSNKEKKDNVSLFIEEYKKVTQFFIEILWGKSDIPKLIPKEITDQAETWLSARAVQCSAKQASGIVRGTKKKNTQRRFVYEKLLEQNLFKKARKLLQIIEKHEHSKPNIKYMNPELDGRFVEFDFDNETTFDCWITLASLGNKLKIQIPLKKTKHLNSMIGKIKTGIRLNEKHITLMFESEDATKQYGKTIGLDIGINSVATTSDNQFVVEDKHGWSFKKIINRMNKKRKDSKGFLRTQRQRTNFINWNINQLNLSNVETLKLENIKNVRFGKRTSKFLNRWTYTEIKGKLEQKCEMLGVQVEYVCPTYTSQRCSSCGWVRRSNRKGQEFKCKQCNHVLNADLNAARNIAANLRPIGTKERLLHKNRTGFYWREAGQESIVPVAQKLA